MLKRKENKQTKSYAWCCALVMPVRGRYLGLWANQFSLMTNLKTMNEPPCFKNQQTRWTITEKVAKTVFLWPLHVHRCTFLPVYECSTYTNTVELSFLRETKLYIYSLQTGHHWETEVRFYRSQTRQTNVFIGFNYRILVRSYLQEYE